MSRFIRIQRIIEKISKIIVRIKAIQKKHKEELKKHLDRLGNTMDLEIVEHNGTYQEALRGLQSIESARLLEPVICDMQGGRKDFSFAIASWAKSLKCQTSSWLVPARYVDRTPQVNTETLVRV